MADRRQTIQQLRSYLEQRQQPRLLLLAIILLATLAGFLSSVALLHAGMVDMTERYGVGCLTGYGVFLLSLRAWLSLQDPGHLIASNVPDADDAAQQRKRATSGTVRGDALDAVGFVGDGIEVFSEVPVVILGVAIAAFALIGIVSAAMVVINAPAFLAELLLDGVVAGAAYRRLRYVPRANWLRGVIRRTALPMLATLALLMGLGTAAQYWMPEARSLGDVVASIMSAGR